MDNILVDCADGDTIVVFSGGPEKTPVTLRVVGTTDYGITEVVELKLRKFDVPCLIKVLMETMSPEYREGFVERLSEKES